MTAKGIAITISGKLSDDIKNYQDKEDSIKIKESKK